MSESSAAAAARDLRPQVPGWVEQTRVQAVEDVAITVEALEGAAQRLAELVAYRSTAEEMVALDVVQRAANTYLAEAGEEFELLSQRLAAGLADRLRSLTAAAASAGDAEGQAIVDAMFTWDRAVRAYTTFVQQYLAGVVQGGGLALGLYLELGPDEYDDVEAVGEVVHRRLSFLPGRVEGSIESWIDEVHTGLEDLLGVLADDPGDANLDTVRGATLGDRFEGETDDARTEVMPLKAVDDATRAARSRAVADPNQERLRALLELADTHKINVRKVPDHPSDRYLDKLESQLKAVVAKREAARSAAHSRKERLAELLVFAGKLRVKVKKIPSNPSTAWLDKMEAKLAQVAARKGVDLPESFEPPTQQEQADTPDLAPVREERDRKAEEARRARAAAMVARAEEAGLELGRVPTVPTDEWISETESRLGDALEQERERSRHKRQRADYTRRERVERLKVRAAQAGIELGPVPPLPTTHWLERIEARVTEALEASPEDSDASLAQLDPELSRRLEDIEARAASHGMSLGAVPPVPDEEWLRWAEERLEEADLAEQPLAVPADAETDQQAYLIYEEGTVQEQIWVVEDEALSIGRARGNVVQIRDDSGVSRRHCTVLRRGRGYVLRDEGSTKGTLVDELEVEEVPLHGGERITIGETNFVFRVR